jgi:septal ring factor EnvC (AmiA/AmiB activator)
MAHARGVPGHASGNVRLMNPLDALLVPPALVKRALDDLHDIAQVVRRLAPLEDEVMARLDALDFRLAGLNEQLAGTRKAVEPLAAQISHMERQLDELQDEMRPIQHLDAIRQGIEPLERSMVAVRDSVDELEPMIADLDTKIRTIEPRLAEMQDSVEPIGDLAERIPGSRRRRSG